MTPFQRPLTVSDAALAAHVHAASFDDAWSEASFAAQFGAQTTTTLGWFEGDALIAFALFQGTAGEADLLTLATLPARRGKGIARQLLLALFETLGAQGVKRLTLDVAEDNLPARHLYTSLGFTEDGRRPRYYTAHRVTPVDAVLMSRPLGV